jgi:hypothetical protein
MQAGFVGIVFGILLTIVNSAWADAIDGTWCHDGNQRLSISGPTIVTAAGSKTEGSYSRHAFSYVAPAGDPGAGGTISMLLLNEDTMQLHSSPQAPVETWLRCAPPVS